MSCDCTCKCSAPFRRDAVGWSTVCDCGIYCSYLLTFFKHTLKINIQEIEEWVNEDVFFFLLQNTNWSYSKLSSKS